jgi:peptidoglycan-N-acetylglucosamine deacetylase
MSLGGSASVLLAVGCTSSTSSVPVPSSHTADTIATTADSSTEISAVTAQTTAVSLSVPDPIYMTSAHTSVEDALVLWQTRTAQAPLASPRETVAAPAPETDEARSDVVSRIRGGRQRVALTFDAGSDTGDAATVLDTLAARGVLASFGLTGRWAEHNPELVRRMAREGHQLINHTYDHDSFTGLSTMRAAQSRAQRWEQLDRTEQILRQIAGVGARPYFRPAYGDIDDSVLADVAARGYTITAMWDVDSLGWTGIPASQIVERTLRLSVPGSIVIFHVGSASADARALPAILDCLQAAGLDCVRLDELLR